MEWYPNELKVSWEEFAYHLKLVRLFLQRSPLVSLDHIFLRNDRQTRKPMGFGLDILLCSEGSCTLAWNWRPQP